MLYISEVMSESLTLIPSARVSSVAITIVYELGYGIKDLIVDGGVICVLWLDCIASECIYDALVLLCSDVTHPRNTDHAPGNLLLTGINRSPALAYLGLLGASAWAVSGTDNRARRTNGSRLLDQPPFSYSSSHTYALLSRGDRPWQVPRTKFQRITMSSEPNKVHNAWSLSLTKTNFLLPCQGHPRHAGKETTLQWDPSNMDEMLGSVFTYFPLAYSYLLHSSFILLYSVYTYVYG
jgi:hypothetical protein